MQPEEVFKRYDIRGRYPEELDEEFAELIGKALGTFALENYGEKIVVGRDNKESSRPLKEALINGLKSTGAHVIDIDIGPTDFAAFTGDQRDAVSVEVTSSHMPLDFNGFKFMYPEGNGFVNEDLYTVQDIFRDRAFTEGSGTVVRDTEALDRYEEQLVSVARRFGDDWDRKIVTESLGGTGEILPRMLEELGAEVIDLNDQDGIYMDPPNPKPENLERMKKKVEEEDAYLGIANDLDADRAAFYLKGHGFLTGDEVFSILAQLIEGPYAASVDTSEALEMFGEVHYTRIGDPFVMEKALDIGAELAGEPNGHYSLTEFVPYNSGMLTGAILAGLDLTGYLEKIPDYSTLRKNIEVEKKDAKMEQIKEVVQERFTVLSDIDGVKYSTGDTTVLIRPSGSSQKIRITAESTDDEELERAMDEAESLVRNA